MEPFNTQTAKKEEEMPLFRTPSFSGGDEKPVDPSQPLFRTPSINQESTRKRININDLGKKPSKSVVPKGADKTEEEMPAASVEEGMLPYFPDEFSSTRPEAPIEKPEGIARTGAYVAQEAGKGVAGMADIATAVIDAAPVIGWAKHKTAQYFGVVEEDAPYKIKFGEVTDLYKDKVLPSVYDAMGYEDLEELDARSAPERGLGFLAENMGAFAPIKLGQVLLKTSKGLTVSAMDSLSKTELTASTLGAGTGAALWGSFESEESKEQAGYLGNFVGGLLPAIKDVSAAYHGYSAAKKYYKNSKLKSGEIDDLSNSIINQDIARMIQEEDIPKIQERVVQLRAFQEIEPEFTVTASSLIRTPYARQVQNLTDTQNPEKATQIYEKNRAIVNRWIEKNGINQESDHFEAIQEAVFNVAAQGEETARSYARKVASLKDDIRSLGRSDATTDPLEVGQDYRQQLSNMERMFKDHVDSMYRAVDPNNKIKIGISDVHTTMRDTRREFIASTPTRTINYETDPGNYLLKDIDAIIKRFDPLEYKVSNPRVNFNSLIEQRKQLDSIARAASGLPNGTQAYGLANSLARSLDGQLDNIMEEAAGDSLGAYRAARSSYRDYYLPVFMQKDSLIVKHLSTYTPKGGDYRQAADKLLRDVWTEDKKPTELGAVQINQMIEKATNITDPDALRVAKEALDLRINDYAVDSLNTALRTTDNPTDAFRKWKDTNEVNLKNFPHVQTNVDEIGRQLTLKEMQIDNLLQQESFVNNTIITRYANRDAEKFVEEIGRMSEAQASRTLKEMMYGGGVKSPYINLPFSREETSGSLLDFSPNITSFLNKLKKRDPEIYKKASEMQRALSSELLNRVIRKGVRNDGYGGLNQSFFNSVFNGNNDSFKLKTLKQVMTPEDYARLKDFHVMSNATADSFTPSGKITTGSIQEMEKELGISLASVSSRVYAQQLGKVGPVYIVSDTGVKLLQAWHVNKFNDRLAEVMYDMDALEEVVVYRAKMLEGNEQEVLLEQMSKLKSIKKRLATFGKRVVKEGPTKFMDLFEAVVVGPTFPTNANRIRAFMEEKAEQEEAKTSMIEHMIQTYEGAYSDVGPAMSTEEWEEFRATLSTNLDVEPGDEDIFPDSSSSVSPDLETNLDSFLSNGLEDGKTYIVDKQTGEIKEEESETND